MKKYKTVIIEDEGPARRRLEKMVENHPNLILSASLRNGMSAITEIPKLNPEILLMDIQLKDATAFEVLDRLDKCLSSKIIFITAFDEYAIKAFEVEALDYLLKPYDEKRFNKAIQRVLNIEDPVLPKDILAALKQRLAPTKETIKIEEGNKDHLFQRSEIKFIEADRYYAEVHTNKEMILIRKSLKSLEHLLPKTFLRINKSVIINMDYIGQIDHKKQSSRIQLKSGEEFFSSKSYNAKLKSYFKNQE